jgi:hypothetical protein
MRWVLRPTHAAISRARLGQDALAQTMQGTPVHARLWYWVVNDVHDAPGLGFVVRPLLGELLGRSFLAHQEEELEESWRL